MIPTHFRDEIVRRLTDGESRETVLYHLEAKRLAGDDHIDFERMVASFALPSDVKKHQRAITVCVLGGAVFWLLVAAYVLMTTVEGMPWFRAGDRPLLDRTLIWVVAGLIVVSALASSVR